jgi:NADH-quinone oxidoreductase subunit L
MGKSAQLGLHTWLPDAMEGPTPVSALIHAATMVTAGVFLLARCSFLFEHSQMALNLVTIIGALTCVFAASIALTQTDIKRIIAYSTCSQLGYMFFACGVSAYSVAIFHLMTHAFFKALLFLGAGSVIHAINDEQDINKMGGLYKLLPVTYLFMWIGSLALAGIFPFSGYFSKDLILEHAHLAGTQLGTFAYWMGIFAALCTAFYSWRLIILVFHKTSKIATDVLKDVHEAPKTMMIPMALLAIGAILVGYVGEYWLSISSATSPFWNGALAIRLHHEEHLDNLIKTLPLIVGVFGIISASVIYLKNPNIAKFFADKLKFIHHLLLNKYYFDEIYDKIFVVMSRKSSIFLWRSFDNGVIDGILNYLARTFFKTSKGLRMLQTGSIYSYSFTMFVGVLAIICLVIFY